MERTPNEHMLQLLFHMQCGLKHMDIINSKTIPTEFTISLQKKMRNFDNYLTRHLKVIEKLYAIDEDAMRTFEDAFDEKVNEVVSLHIKDFLTIEE